MDAVVGIVEEFEWVVEFGESLTVRKSDSRSRRHRNAVL
jgi:hypothetical protein